MYALIARVVCAGMGKASVIMYAGIAGFSPLAVAHFCSNFRLHFTSHGFSCTKQRVQLHPFWIEVFDPYSINWGTCRKTYLHVPCPKIHSKSAIWAINSSYPTLLEISYTYYNIHSGKLACHSWPWRIPFPIGSLSPLNSFPEGQFELLDITGAFNMWNPPTGLWPDVRYGTKFPQFPGVHPVSVLSPSTTLAGQTSCLLK